MNPSEATPGPGADLPGAGAYYERIGFAGRVGFGRRPAVIVVDCIHACANPALSPIGIAMDGELRNIRRLLDRVRTKRFPAGEYQVPCALIIGQRKESTDKKTSLNAALRDFAVPV